MKPAQTQAYRLYQSAKQGAKKRKIEFDLSVDDVTALLKRSGGYCQVTGAPLNLRYNKSERRPWASSVDRIESKYGYRLNNCRIVCVVANIAMNVWGDSVLINMLRHMQNRHKRSLNDHNDILMAIDGFVPPIVAETMSGRSWPAFMAAIERGDLVEGRDWIYSNGGLYIHKRSFSIPNE